VTGILIHQCASTNTAAEVVPKNQLLLVKDG